MKAPNQSNQAMKAALQLVPAAMCGTLCLSMVACQTKPQQPNVIYILADDLGPGDLGCYGQTMIKTPNIDKLATQGMLFTDHYSGSTVSAPSRSTLLTGLHTGNTPIRGNRELKGAEGQYPMAAATFTMPEMFQQAGYATGAFGKWGLGFPGSEGDPNMQGFDEFYGYNCQREAHRYYPRHIWHNQEKVMLEGNDNGNCAVYAPDLIHTQSLDYIRENATAGKPFFAYLALVQPHAELIVPEDEVIEQYRGKFPETPFVAPQVGANYGDADFKTSYYCSQAEPHATFAAMVTRLDRYVGDVMNLIDELGIADNTIIIFSSDNGPHLEGGADPDFWNSNAGRTGYKRDLTEGGIRTPMIVRWNGTVKAGSTSDHVSAFWDVMPTMAQIVGYKQAFATDGISMLGALKGKKQKQHDYLYWEYTEGKGDMAVRMGDWKAIRTGLHKKADGPVMLYNLKNDPKELTDVAGANPELVEKALEIMKREHTHNPNYTFGYERMKGK